MNLLMVVGAPLGIPLQCGREFIFIPAILITLHVPDLQNSGRPCRTIIHAQ